MSGVSWVGAVTAWEGNVVEFVRQFFSTLPEALAAVWEFVDGVYGLTVLGVSLVIIAGFLLLAHRLRPGHEWLSAVFGVLGGGVVFWWLFAILPSAWVYFASGERDLLEGTVLPGAIPGADNFYMVFRDVVVVGETAVAIVAFIVAGSWIQKHFPRQLAEDEEKQPSTGGYK